MLSNLTVSFGPHLRQPLSTRRVMLDVVIGLAPAMLAAGYYFRSHAVVLLATCVVSAVVTEWVCNLLRRRPRPTESLGDLSAVVTGVILALSLPPALPAWVAVIGSAFSIGIGKMVFGGLGSNIFNPAMVGRTFLTASFGILMTTWTVPATMDSGMPAMAPGNADAMTQATPLSWSKRAWKGQAPERRREFVDNVDRYWARAFMGERGGCLGETSALALILGGLYMLIRKTITFHVPVAVLLGALGSSGLAYVFRSEGSITPVGHLLSGGLLLGAFFIASDPVTRPLTHKGMWVFGAGVGILTILIRTVGEYPEGVMYAVLLMNAVSPLIDRWCKLAPVGGKPNA